MRLVKSVRGLLVVAAMAVGGCGGMQAADKCQKDLGVNWVPSSCIVAVQDASNQSLVAALGNEACARAKLTTNDPAIGSAACDEARVKAEKGAWIEIERSAVAGRQPRLVLDELVPGLPKAPPATDLAGPTSGTVSPSRVVTATQSQALAPSLTATASINGNTLSLPTTQRTDSPGAPPETATSVASDIPMGTVAYLDARNGFRGVKFGEPPKPGMVLIENDDNSKFYRRESDDMTMGSGRCSEIVYGFYKNQLYTVLLKTKGIIDSQALLGSLRAAYGSGDQPNEYLDRYFWRGTFVRVIYDENVITHGASAVLDCIAISAQKEADEKAAAARSGGNL